MRIYAILIIFVLCAGCASNKGIAWYKDGATKSEFAKDKYECIQESKVSWSGGGSGDLGLILMLGAEGSAKQQSRRIFNACMEARGYYTR